MYVGNTMPIPCTKLWGSKIYDMVQTLYIGVLTLYNEKGGDDNVSFANYGDVGFGLDGGY